MPLRVRGHARGLAAPQGGLGFVDQLFGGGLGRVSFFALGPLDGPRVGERVAGTSGGRGVRQRTGSFGSSKKVLCHFRSTKTVHFRA